MTPYPDPLFREGLEHYRKPAPASAWERIESGLDKKKRKSPWLKIAAGLVLLMAASILLWKLTPNDTAVATVSKESAPIASNTDTSPSVEAEELKDTIRESSDVSRELEATDITQTAQSSFIVERSRNNHRDAVHGNPPVVERSRNEPSRSNRQSAVGSGQSTVTSLQSSVYSLQSLDKSKDGSPDGLNNKATTLAELPTIEERADVANINVPPDPRGTTISYSADMVNERFIKKECVAEATPEKKNASGLQKVIEKALDLKNEESLFGDFREKKNEWLTINYPAKKRESNK